MNINLDKEEFKSNEKNNDNEIQYCNEEDLLDEVNDDFSYQIKERGKDYYNSNNVISCYKKMTK